MLPLNRVNIPALYQAALDKQRAGNLDGAEAAYRDLARLAPKQAEVPYRLAQIARARGRPQDGIADLERALALKPQEKALWLYARDHYESAGMTDKVLDAFDKLSDLEPGQIKPKADKALFLQSVGDFDGAARMFRKLIKQHPYEGELYRVFLGGTKLPAGDPLIGQMVKALKHPRMTDLGKMHLGYALAKTMEDTGQTDKVFGYLRLANGLQKKLFPPDLAAREAERRAVLAAQAGGLTPRTLPGGTPTPIFVTGMPRSGTTLVEQIIGAHSRVQAGGEIGHALKLAYKAFGAGAAMKPLAGIADAALARFAADYRTALRIETTQDAEFVTDKSMLSELVFGLVRTALPDAKIVIVHRDPRDIALSIYKNHFREGTHRYANDLADIATAIRAFQASVTFWKDHMPGALYEVQYEDLVADPEPQARALLQAVGLPWEDGCLEFHKGGGVVKTLSLAQVRQPIHAGRKEAWRRYEADLKPFAEAWEASAP